MILWTLAEKARNAVLWAGLVLATWCGRGVR